jgi:hypothetical protein
LTGRTACIAAKEPIEFLDTLEANAIGNVVYRDISHLHEATCLSQAQPIAICNWCCIERYLEEFAAV